VSIIENRGTDDVAAGPEHRGQVNRVGLRPARVGRCRSPLDAAAVDLEPVTAFRGHPADGPLGLGIEFDLSAEEDKGVRQTSSRRIPNPAGRFEVGQAAFLSGKRCRGIGRRKSAFACRLGYFPAEHDRSPRQGG
jgi:hypothetical protein